MTPIAQRFAIGTPLLAAVAGLLLWDRAGERPIGTAILAALLAPAGAVEFARMFRLARVLSAGSAALALVVVGTTAAVALPREGWLDPAPAALRGLVPAGLALLAVAPALAVVALFRTPPGGDALRRASTALFGALWVSLPLAAIVLLAAEGWGAGWVLFLVLVVKGNDIGAYLVGRTWGRTPLTSISPRKTREGSVGGLVWGIATAVAVVLIDPAAPLGTLAAAAIALAVGFAGQTGDLVESWLKRAAGVKDSAGLIPQFGGVLDLLDSILFAGPVLLVCAAVAA